MEELNKPRWRRSRRKTKVERSAERLLEALDRQTERWPKSINVREAAHDLRTSLGR